VFAFLQNMRNLKFSLRKTIFFVIKTAQPQKHVIRHNFFSFLLPQICKFQLRQVDNWQSARKNAVQTNQDVAKSGAPLNNKCSQGLHLFVRPSQKTVCLKSSGFCRNLSTTLNLNLIKGRTCNYNRARTTQKARERKWKKNKGASLFVCCCK